MPEQVKHCHPRSTVVIDCAGVATGDEFWQRYLSATQPEGATSFGCNLDAFWDAIEHGGPGWPNANLIIKNTENLDVGFLEKLRSIANAAALTQIEVT